MDISVFSWGLVTRSNSVLQCVEAAGALESRGCPLRVSHSQCNPSHQQHPEPLSSVVCAWKGPVEPGCLSLALLAIKGEPNTPLKPYILQNTDRKGKDPPYGFRFWKSNGLRF